MLAESIALIVFVLSLAGVLFILYRKIPALSSLPQNGSTGIREHHFILNIETKIKEILIYIEKQIFLHKLLSWIKVMTLKIETRIDVLLHKIRRRAQQIDKEKTDKK